MHRPTAQMHQAQRLTMRATVPDASSATPVGWKNDAAEPNPSADPPTLPATVVTRAEEMTIRRIRALSVSTCVCVKIGMNDTGQSCANPTHPRQMEQPTRYLQ